MLQPLVSGLRNVKAAAHILYRRACADHAPDSIVGLVLMRPAVLPCLRTGEVVEEGHAACAPIVERK